MTHEIVGSLTAVSDLLLRSSRRGGNVLETMLHIPGSALRGALGARWVERHGVDERFRELFQSGRLRFHDARADIDGGEAFVVPLSFVTAKEQPYAAHTFDLVTGAERPAGVPLRRVRGEITADGVVRPGGPPTVTRSRIATFSDEDTSEGAPDPARDGRALRGLAADGGLFSETRLAAGTTFTARISGDPALLEELSERLLPSAGPDTVRIGRSRTVLGLADVAWRDLAAAPTRDPDSGDVHTLVALSDLVLLDRFQRAVVDLDAAALAAMIGVASDEVEVLPGGEVRATEVGGWDGPNRMPARVDRAVRAGSTVRFRAPSDAVLQLAVDPWVGWRRAEGHGHVAIDWSVHRLASLREVPTATASERAPQVRERGVADRALRLIDGFDRRTPSSTVWSQVVEAVRAGVELSVLASDAGAGEVREDGKGSERRAGRGAGSGGARRAERREIARAVVDAFEEAGIAGPDDAEARLALVVHAGREVRLRELRSCEKQRRDDRAAGRSSGPRPGDAGPAPAGEGGGAR
jgi:hypothetical protein